MLFSDENRRSAATREPEGTYHATEKAREVGARKSAVIRLCIEQDSIFEVTQADSRPVTKLFAQSS